ncbi:MAG: phosphoribulokinase [Clostridia bacterium]|nr:phosphoribulokinase [Clostridia bacterium]
MKEGCYPSLLAEIDRRLAEGPLVLVIEGGAASGKTTLGAFLGRHYGATLLHTDDFFLRPEQRTEGRLSEVGGNLDRERFLAEVLTPLARGEEIAYRRYDCAEGRLLAPTPVRPGRLTVVEGSYAMHEAFGCYYGLAVFLDVTPERQRERILARDPDKAERFFSAWIPMERAYHAAMRVRERCDLVIYAE